MNMEAQMSSNCSWFSVPMIKRKGKLNGFYTVIIQIMLTWRESFLFPEREQSVYADVKSKKCLVVLS